MAFGYKKENKEFYLLTRRPSIASVLAMKHLAVRSRGKPNFEDGKYKQSIDLLYVITFTTQMSKKGNHRIAEYFNYVVSLFEEFWWQDGASEIENGCKENSNFIFVIRHPIKGLI